MNAQYNAPEHGNRLTTERNIPMHSRSSSTPAALTTHQDPLDSESTKRRWIAYTTIRPDPTPQNIPIPAQERKQEMKFYLDTRTQPHPLPQPTTSKFTAQKKRNAKPPYAVYFQLLLLHLQKTNKETTSHPPPSHQTPDLRQIVLHTKQIAHQPTKRTGLQQIAHQPTKRTGLYRPEPHPEQQATTAH
jgi:hypothetical protein